MQRKLLQYEEFTPKMGYPSIKNSFCSKPYEGQEAVANYLKMGKVILAAPSVSKDAFTGDIISGGMYIMTDGEYSWPSELAYYVEKYNMRLEPEFEKKVLRKG